MREYFADFRSDTVTKPCSNMLDAMFSAKVGDDVFGEDPTVNELQDYAAKLFGTEAALFCSSGTQTNQIAIKLHTQPGSELICDAKSHIYLYEGGGIAFNSGASARLIQSERGMFSAADVVDNINKDDVHFPTTKLVSLENTVNKGGGACWNWDEIVKIKEVCIQNNLAFHLDGARLFNALTESKQSAKDYGKTFDTISICLSKGLGAPVGSLLLGSNQSIKQAKRIRKVLGGGMRQAGFLAAAGLFALKNNIDRLSEDHKKAKHIESILKNYTWVDSILPVETNIIIFKTEIGINADDITQKLAKNGIKISNMGKNLVRLVFHLNHSDTEISQLEDALKKIQETVK